MSERRGHGRERKRGRTKFEPSEPNTELWGLRGDRPKERTAKEKEREGQGTEEKGGGAGGQPDREVDACFIKY